MSEDKVNLFQAYTYNASQLYLGTKGLVKQTEIVDQKAIVLTIPTLEKWRMNTNRACMGRKMEHTEV